MQIFKSRPLCVIITVSLLIIAGCAFVPAAFGLISALTVAGLMFVYILFNKYNKRYNGQIMTAIIAAIFITVSGFRGHFYFYNAERVASECYGNTYLITATVKETIYSNNYSSAMKLRIEELDGEPVDFTVFCECEYQTDFSYGDKIRLTATIHRLDALFEEGRYSRMSALSGGYTAYATSDTDSCVLISEGSGIRSSLERFNAELCSELIYYLGEDCGALASALALGNQKYVPEEVSRDFARSGLAHILALSGSHIVLIIGTFDKLLLNCFTLGKKPRSIIMLLTVPLYVIFVMSPTPVIRAGVMYMIMCSAVIIGKDSDSMTNLFLSVFLMVIASPSMLFSISLWMSFLATLALIVFMLPLTDRLADIRQTVKHKRAFDVMRAVFLSIVMCVLGSGANIIFSWATFGTFSTVSLPANVVFGPLLTLLLSLFMVFLFLIPFPLLASVASVPIKALGEFTLSGIESFASFKYSVVSLRHTFAAVICIVLFIIFCLFLVLKIKRKSLVFVPIFILLSAFTIFYVRFVTDEGVAVAVAPRSDNEMTVVQKGDSFSLIDASNGRFTNLSFGAEKAKNMGACEFDSIVLTHFHRYHVSSLNRLFNRETVRNLLVPEPQNDYDKEVFTRLSELCAEKGIPITVCRSSVLTEVTRDVFISDIIPERVLRSTHPLVSYSLHIGEKTIVYTGASVNESESFDDIKRRAEASHCLLIGRHGPVPKQMLEYAFSENTEVYIINETMLGYLSDVSLDSASQRGKRQLLYEDGVTIYIE